MSASEKLKALEADPDFTRCMEMQRALPQIVAVVEAAELAATTSARNDVGRLRSLSVDLSAALAALEEALS